MSPYSSAARSLAPCSKASSVSQTGPSRFRATRLRRYLSHVHGRTQQLAGEDSHEGASDIGHLPQEAEAEEDEDLEGLRGKVQLELGLQEVGLGLVDPAEERGE